jgi:hypothetical protein
MPSVIKIKGELNADNAKDAIDKLHQKIAETTPHAPDSFQIGECFVGPGRAGNDRVWISHSSGDGGDFDRQKFEKYVEKFFIDNF